MHGPSVSDTTVTLVAIAAIVPDVVSNGRCIVCYCYLQGQGQPIAKVLQDVLPCAYGSCCSEQDSCVHKS